MILTWYHRRESGWQRNSIRPLWAYWVQGVHQGGTIPRDDGDASQLGLPMEGDFTPALGDGVLLGEGPELLAGPLKSQLPDVQIVTKVRRLQVGSPLDHWEVEAK